MSDVTQLSYLVASALFIFALHWMNTPATVRGNWSWRLLRGQIDAGVARRLASLTELVDRA